MAPMAGSATAAAARRPAEALASPWREHERGHGRGHASETCGSGSGRRGFVLVAPTRPRRAMGEGDPGGLGGGRRGIRTCGTGEAAARDEAGEGGGGGGGGGRRRRNETRCHRDDSTRSGLAVSRLGPSRFFCGGLRLQSGGGGCSRASRVSRFLSWAGPGESRRVQ